MMTSQLKMKTGLIGLCFSMLGLFLVSSGCAEVAGSGAFVSIPSVSFQCVGGGCAVNGSRFVHVSYSTSSCAAAEFGQVVTGSVFVNCNGSQCAGSVSSFIDSQGTATSIKEGFYSVCVTIDVNNDWSAGPAINDMIGGNQNVQIGSGTSTQSITSFSLKTTN